VTELRSGSATDVGIVRGNNEDQLLVAETLFAVADGMGGHAAGEVASMAAVEALRAEYARQPHTVDGLVEAVRQANRAVWDRGSEDPSLRGMGTTLTAIALVEDQGEEHVAIANVGDSRAYLMRDGELGMLTDDHSVAEQMMREGRLTPEEAAVHPQRHVLYRVLGMAPEVEVDCYPILPYRGDRYLLCSDGLINEVSDGQIASVLRRLADPQEAVDELVAMARANGGHDNITVVLVDVVDDDDRSGVASAALAGEPPSSSATVIAPLEADEERDEPPAPVAPPVPPGEPAASTAPAPPKSRRVTLRVVAFLVVLLVVLGAAVVVVGYYARGSYYVGIDRGHVVIFQGRPGGLLWFDPTVYRRTDLAVADIPPSRVDAVRAGKEEPSVAAARRYIQNLRDEHDQLVAASGATTTTSTVPGATPASPPTTGSVTSSSVAP
jgi:protein phosphatase